MRLALCALVIAGCSKDTGRAPDHQPPRAPARASSDGGIGSASNSAGNESSDAKDPCPRATGARTTAARKIGIYSTAYPHQDGWVWRSQQWFKVIDSSGKAKRAFGNSEVPRGARALDAGSWFVEHCEAGGCGEHGTGVVIDRVSMFKQPTVQLVGPQSEIVWTELVGDYLYWGTFGPYGQTGEFRRIHPDGGDVETLWTGSGVTAVLIDGSTAFVSDGRTVSAVPIDGRKPHVLAKDLVDVTALAADAKDLYIVDRGDPYWQSKDSGSILRVPRDGGTVTKLVGPIRWPTTVAVDDDRVYYMADHAGDIWSMPKSGGSPTILVPTPPGDWPCRMSKWLRADASGLHWIRIDDGIGFVNGALWYLPRSMLRDPQAQWRDNPTDQP
jgi:hypothetical protein